MVDVAQIMQFSILLICLTCIQEGLHLGGLMSIYQVVCLGLPTLACTVMPWLTLLQRCAPPFSGYLE